MKKLVCVLGMILFIVSCKSIPNQLTQTSSLKKATERVSLNGISYLTADSMVNKFKSDSMSSDAKTAVWLSKAWVDNVDSILNVEGADGFRIYFAKTIAKNNFDKNAVVIVSTRDDGPGATPSGGIHLDYFGHTSPFFLSNASKDTQEYSNIPGATLYNKNTDCTGDCILGPINNISCANAAIAVKQFVKGYIDTKSEWFPIDLLNGLKNELDNDNSIKTDGIRIYFALHSAQTNPGKAGMHAFIIITTRIITDPATNKTIPRADYYSCLVPFHGYDNGEQCPTNCTGATLP